MNRPRYVTVEANVSEAKVKRAVASGRNHYITGRFG